MISKDLYPQMVKILYNYIKLASGDVNWNPNDATDLINPAFILSVLMYFLVLLILKTWKSHIIQNHYDNLEKLYKSTRFTDFQLHSARDQYLWVCF